MARNGVGVYTLPAGQPVTTGTSVSSATHNTLAADIATALTQSIASDGQTVPTANLPMGGNRHTGVSNATARTDYCTAGQSQDNTFDWLTGITGTDTITATAAIGMTAYAAGQTFRFVSAGANTGAVTLTINAIAGGAKAITKNGTTALAAGDIPSGAVVEVVYDGTQFQFVGCTAKKAQSGANSDITSLSGMTTPLSIAQGGTGSTSGVASVPPGTIIDFAGSAAQIPAGYLLCDGTAYSRTVTYNNLFAAIGVLWGVGDGATTFNVPNFPAFYAAVQNNGTVGASTTGVVKAHTHSALEATGASAFAGGASNNVNVGVTGSTGGAANLAAGMCVLKCIKY